MVVINSFYFFFKNNTIKGNIQQNILETRIFDVIFFYNEVDLLNKRIEYLRPNVTKFVVLNFGPIFLNAESDDVVIYNTKFKKGPFFRNNFFDYLFFLFDFDEFIYNDVFVFSRVNEIPNLTELQSTLNTNFFEPIILSHQSFGWHPNLISDKSHFGSRIIKFTDYLQNKSISKLLFNENPLMSHIDVVENGFYLYGFSDIYQTIDTEKFWLEDNFPYYIDFPLLKSQHNMIDGTGKIKHLKKIEISSLPILFYDLSQFEFTDELYDLEIDLTREGNEIGYTFNQRYIIESIELPKTVLYSDKSYDLFLEDYKKNETLRILNQLPYTKIGTVSIKKTTETVVFETSELMSSVPSELF